MAAACGVAGFADGTLWQASAQDVGETCHNWSGSLHFRPSRVVAPATAADLAEIVRRARAERRTVRPVGSAHSSSPLYATDDILVSLERFTGVASSDTAAARAVVGAGTTIIDGGRELHALGLSLPNLGDVATQTMAGVIATGTHGSGRTLHNLSMMLVGGTLVTGTGEIREVDFGREPDLVRALRVSLGAAGIFTSLRLQLLPAYELVRNEWCTDAETALPRIDALADENRNFDFYWYPRSDEVKLRVLNPPGKAPDYSHFARLAEDRTGPPHEVIPKHSDLSAKFEEMECALPAEAGLACFGEIRRRMRERWRRTVAWRVLYRFIRSDDSWLSEAHGRETATISLHQNATLPFRDFFEDVEPVFRVHGGRPHWAKLHGMTAEDLAPLYPMWQRFAEIRRELDPDGVLLTPYLRRLLGVPR